MKNAFVAALTFAAVVSGEAHASLVVDGNLDDWGINRTSWVSSLTGVHSAIEDTTGNSSVYLNPGYGGQAYDAEAMYAIVQDGKLFVALITGHNPLTANKPGSNSYGAGDFAIDFGKDGTYELGINLVNGFGIAGGVYANPGWAYGLWDTNGSYNPANPDKANPTSLQSGTLIGMADFDYTTTGVSGYGQWTNDRHYFYEFSIDTDLLTLAGWDGSSFNIHWTENCANDSILVDPGSASIPEPGSLALLGLGGLGLAAGRRRHGKRRQ